MQRLGAVVEAVGRGVRRQQVLQIDVDAQQVAHRVLVLGPVQAAQDHSALRGTPGGLRRCRPSADPVGQGLDVFRRRTGLLLRRHRARLDLLEHGQPPLAVGLVGKILREALQAEVALGLRPRVTGLTVLREKRPGRVGSGLGIRAGCARRLACQRANQQGNEEEYSSHTHRFSRVACDALNR